MSELFEVFFGKSLVTPVTTYTLEPTLKIFDFDDTGYSSPRLMEVNFCQSMKTTINKWTIFSLNDIFGLVGGVAGTLWMILGFTLGGYEGF